MRKSALYWSCTVAVAAVLWGSTNVRADVVALTEGTPAPSLSPTLNFDVNFDSVPTGTLITAGLFSADGISSITNAGDPLYTSGGTQSQPNYVGTGAGDGWAMDTTIVFGTLQSEVGFGAAGPNTIDLTAYGTGGTQLFTESFSSASNDYWVLTDSTGANISSIEISSSFIAIDDVQFNNVGAPPVPEPSPLLLLVTGILAFGLLSWGRSAAGFAL